MSDKVVVLIIGMIRSGTSAVTRVLSLSGCTLPHAVLGAQDWNPTGNWDPIEALKLNADFLLRHGTMLGDPTLRLREIDFDENDREEFIGHICAFLTECPDAPVLVIKEQCITDLLEFWIEGARRAGYSPKILIPIRHPGEVFASMTAATRGTAMVECINAMWLKYNLLAERCSRGLPRVFIEYSNLMKAWRVELARVSKALSIELNIDGNSAVDQFITGGLYRQKSSEHPLAETFSDPWMSRTYSILSAAAQDGSIEMAALNEIYDAYRMNERAFRLSWDSFREEFNPQRTREIHDQLLVWTSGREF